MKNFKIKLISKNIPYVEGSNEWHKLVDIHTAVNSDRETSLLELCSFHDMSPKYYKDLSILIKDNLIEVLDENF